MSQNSPPLALLTRDQVDNAVQAGQLWVIIDDHVFDLTHYSEHPGGREVLLRVAGKDATREFDEARHVDGLELMGQFCVGRMDSANAI
jgi:cytochrome-b5 reductase